MKLGSFCAIGVVGVAPPSGGVKYRGGRPAACVVFRVRFAFFGGGSGGRGVRCPAGGTGGLN